MSGLPAMQNLDYDGFAAHLALHDRRSTTIRKHVVSLKYLEKRGVILKKDVLEVFLVKLKLEGKSGSYLNSFVDATRLYARFKGLEPELQQLKQFKEKPGIKATLSDEEIEAFLGLPRRSHQPQSHHTRMNMFWALVAFTGMRPGECAKLKPNDIDWGRGVISIEVTKTNTPGIVPIPQNIKYQLGNYLSTVKGEYLFPSLNGGNHYSAGGEAVINNVAWHFDWKKRLTKLKLRRSHLTPYSFRHSYATRLLEENVSLFHVKKLMRHNDLRSTLVYEHLTTKDLIEANAKLPLIRKGSDPKVILAHLVELIKSFHIEKDGRFRFAINETADSLLFQVEIAQKSRR